MLKNTIEISRELQENELYQVAYWHNLTPKQWIVDYKVTEEAIEETVKSILSTSKDSLYILCARMDNVIVGFIWAYRMNSSKAIMIKSLYVEESKRNNGIASLLKMQLEKYCKEDGICEIHTTVHYNNVNMLALNQKLGYKAGMVTMIKRISEGCNEQY